MSIKSSNFENLYFGQFRAYLFSRTSLLLWKLWNKAALAFITTAPLSDTPR